MKLKIYDEYMNYVFSNMKNNYNITLARVFLNDLKLFIGVLKVNACRY